MLSRLGKRRDLIVGHPNYKFNNGLYGSHSLMSRVYWRLSVKGLAVLLLCAGSLSLVCAARCLPEGCR